MISYKRRESLFFIVLLIPGLLCFLLLIVYPLVLTIAYSFTNMHLFYPSGAFVGFKNFSMLFRPESEFFIALKNGIIWTVCPVFMELAIGMLAAIALQKIKFGSTVFKLALIIPWAFTDTSLAFTWRWLLEPTRGIINYMLKAVGIISQPIGWFGSAEKAMPSVIMMHVWFGFPFMMLALFAGLQAVPQDCYDAATVDGASWSQRFRYVTLPFLSNIIFIIAILRTIWTFNNFSFIFLTTAGGPGTHTLIMPVLAYNIGWRQGFIGQAAAVVTLSMGLMLVLAFLVLRRHEERTQ